MSSIDTDKAIEKLTEYREETEEATESSWQKTQANTEDPKARKYFLTFYWVNAVIATTMGLSLLMAGWAIGLNWLIWGLLAVISFVLTRQTFGTIERLEESNGRNTTIDDVFIIILIAALSLLYNLFLPFSPTLWWFVYGVFAALWVLQIVFVNFLKAEFGSGKIQTPVGQETTGGQSRIQRLQQYFSKERIYVVGISLVLAILVSINPILTAL